MLKDNRNGSNDSDSSNSLLKYETSKSPTKSKEPENAPIRSSSKMRLEAIVESENETEYLFTCQSDISKLEKIILDRVTIQKSDINLKNEQEQLQQLNSIKNKEEIVLKLERQLAKVQKEVVRLKRSTSLVKKKEHHKKEQENQGEQIEKNNDKSITQSKSIQYVDRYHISDDGNKDEKKQNAHILLSLDENIIGEKQSLKQRKLSRSPTNQQTFQGFQMNANFRDINTPQPEGRREVESAQSLDSKRIKHINTITDQRRRRSQKIQDDSLSLCLPPICIPSRASSLKYPGSLSARSTTRVCFEDLSKNEEDQQYLNLSKMVGSIERTRWWIKPNQQQQYQSQIQTQPQQSQVKLRNRYNMILRDNAERVLKKEEKQEYQYQTFENTHHNPFMFEQQRSFKRSDIPDNLISPFEKKQSLEPTHHLQENTQIFETLTNDKKLRYLKNNRGNNTASRSREISDLSYFEPELDDNDMKNNYSLQTQNQTRNLKTKEQCQSYEQQEWEKIAEKMIFDEMQNLKMPTKTPRRKKQSAKKEGHKISIKDLKPLLFPSYTSPLSSLDSKQPSTSSPSSQSSKSSQYFINSRLSLTPNSLKKI